VPEVLVPRAWRWAPKRWRCSAWQCGRGAGESEVADTLAGSQHCSQGTGGRDHGADPAAQQAAGRYSVHIREQVPVRGTPVQRRGRVGGSNRLSALDVVLTEYKA
jgi:hypothetical protein